MLQEYEPPADGRLASWRDTATRYVQLKPRRYGQEPDPVSAYCVRHMRTRQRSGQPQFRVKVREYEGPELRHQFVVHIDGTRTSISD
ncbi:hypothetical protein [Streptomyces sp. NPDC017260]|uniref:hypothetical protein n=1 Tax=unclassified Streptomyces TaxID=2593676 RepID=UPI0037AC4CCC